MVFSYIHIKASSLSKSKHSQLDKAIISSPNAAVFLKSFPFFSFITGKDAGNSVGFKSHPMGFKYGVTDQNRSSKPKPFQLVPKPAPTTRSATDTHSFSSRAQLERHFNISHRKLFTPRGSHSVRSRTGAAYLRRLGAQRARIAHSAERLGRARAQRLPSPPLLHPRHSTHAPAISGRRGSPKLSALPERSGSDRQPAVPRAGAGRARTATARQNRPRSARCPEPSPAPRSTPASQSAAQQGGRPLRLRAQPPTLAGLPAAARSATQHSGGGPRRGRPRRCSLPGGPKAAAGRGLRGSADSRSGPRRSRRNIAAQPGGRARKPDRPNTRPPTAGALLLKGTGARLGRLLCKGEGAPRRAVWWQREGRSLSWRSSAAPWVGGINLSAGGASPPGCHEGEPCLRWLQCPPRIIVTMIARVHAHRHIHVGCSKSNMGVLSMLLFS